MGALPIKQERFYLDVRMLLLVVCFQLSAENILGNVTVDDVTDEEVRCTETLLRVLLSAWTSDLFLIFDSYKQQ